MSDGSPSQFGSVRQGFLVGTDDAEKRIVPVLSCVLNQLIARNDRLAFNPQHLTVFHALKPPAISIQKYLERIFMYASCSKGCFIVALIYIDRVIQRHNNFLLTSLNVHRLLITSVMLAAKFFDDIYYNNAYYAKVGGVPNTEINSLELEFLFMINFSLNVAPEVFDQYERELAFHSRNTPRLCSCEPVALPGEELKSSQDEDKE
eukprot:TRINITY_DN3075_c0_g1::TRINITY_DN3075_c0_g1_i1::g.22316::m.22316 TRINITY_DN3075_c0_g1::TRINITY_DN3075_c0_g1_i1::g.22316  ORF type:complete len:227 (-),score=2.09,sp/O80513/CCU41_ARATH/54.11/3e-49,Cyclin/PF08613.6/2.8e-35,Cyclin/PF08613.6/1.3e+04,Cyclin_N/PF00134.18/2.4e-10 TRINITY_DN3075_c0_g1_i1:658-1272(-)